MLRSLKIATGASTGSLCPGFYGRIYRHDVARHVLQQNEVAAKLVAPKKFLRLQNSCYNAHVMSPVSAGIL